jgi:hypothetical protein
LALALIVAVTVAAASAGVLLVSSHFARRQSNAVHDQRAFYLAEAGLSEAYNAMTIGQSGQIGSMEAPARSGDGLLWVEAIPNDERSVRLESTAMVGLGRASLALVVERIEQPLGIFANEDLIISAPILVDGYDSEEAPYEEQVQKAGIVKVPKEYCDESDSTEWADLIADPAYHVTEFMGVEFLVVDEDDEHYFLELLDTDDSDMPSALKMLHHIYNGNAPFDELPVEWSLFPELAAEFGINVEADSDTGWAAPTYPDADATQSGYVTDVASEPVDVDLGSHTSGSGRLSSNGDIHFTGTSTEIYGDAIPGPEGEVVLGAGNLVSGHTSARPQAVELPPVSAPPVALQPAVEYGGAAPMIIPPSTVGYDSLTVLHDAEVIVQGPSTLVLGDFELQSRACFQVVNLDGPVDMYVIRSAQLNEGSEFCVESQDPSQLTLRFIGDTDPVQLASTSAFRGMIYGPEAAISVRKPFEVFGVLVGKTLDLGAGVRLHFDAGIAGGADRLNLPKLISWDVLEVPPEIRTKRMDPFEALQVDREGLESAVDASVNYSWTLKVVYQSKSLLKEVTYEGPLETFEPWDVESRVSTTRTPPDVAFAEPWRVWARHRSPKGETEWEGTVAEYRPKTLGRLIERSYTPPPELGAKGYESVYHVAR